MKKNLQIVLLVIGLIMFVTLTAFSIATHNSDDDNVKYRKKTKTVEISEEDAKALEKIAKDLEEIEKNEIKIQFLLCKMELIDKVSYDEKDYEKIIDSIANSEDVELILKECAK